jgi:hypothetical protein
MIKMQYTKIKTSPIFSKVIFSMKNKDRFSHTI